VRDSKNEVVSATAADGYLIAAGVKAAIDRGNLRMGERLLTEGLEALSAPSSRAELEVALTLRLEEATVAQYRGDFAQAFDLAEESVVYADEHFGPRGIHIGRARLRHNFAMEANREFSRAFRGNLELADQLVRIPGSDAIRLNCLTRAIACAVKNADRDHLRTIGLQSEPIRMKLSWQRDHGVLRWHLFWSAVASLRQDRVEDANFLIDRASELAPQSWRWDNAANFVRGYGLTFKLLTEAEGWEVLRAARRDAEERGFHGLVRSIDAGFSS
jgi:hypothetical protein